MKLPLVVAAILFVSCSKEPTEDKKPDKRRPTVTFNVADPEKQAATKALSILQNSCGGIRGLFTELAGVQIFSEPAAEKTRGWTRVIRIEMLMRKTDELSGQYQGRKDIGGSTFTFQLGGGREPGIATGDAFGQVLCGAEFRPVPALAFIELPPLPERIDFAKLFTLQRTGAIAKLGEPTPDPDHSTDDLDDDDDDDLDDDEFFIGSGLRLVLEYRDGLASRAFISSEAFPTAALLAWIGEIDSDAIHLDAPSNPGDAGHLWVNSKRMPRKKIDAQRILGGSKDAVRRYLGTADVGDTSWHRDGYMVNILFDDKNIVRYLEVSFDPGIRPEERTDEVRRWMGLPVAGEHVSVRGSKYVPRADSLSITWERRYL